MKLISSEFDNLPRATCTCKLDRNFMSSSSFLIRLLFVGLGVGVLGLLGLGVGVLGLLGLGVGVGVLGFLRSSSSRFLIFLFAAFIRFCKFLRLPFENWLLNAVFTAASSFSNFLRSACSSVFTFDAAAISSSFFLRNSREPNLSLLSKSLSFLKLSIFFNLPRAPIILPAFVAVGSPSISFISSLNKPSSGKFFNPAVLRDNLDNFLVSIFFLRESTLSLASFRILFAILVMAVCAAALIFS